MDNVTLGGSKPMVADDINTTTTIGSKYGLQLNVFKCEDISNTGDVSQ